jgi:nicotinate phosphoribosyltransferase
MQNAVIKLFPRAEARYEFINRGKTKFPPGFAVELKKHIHHLARIKLTKDEKEFLRKRCYYLDPTYLDFLSGYHFDPGEVKISQKENDVQVVVEGYWYRTILWEVPLLAMISELYHKLKKQTSLRKNDIVQIVREKASLYDKMNAKVAEFGTRRRYSYHNHDLIIRTISEHSKSSFIGTSNIHFAMKYNAIPIGTHAHEWFMFHSAKYGFKMANRLSLENWVNVYRGDLGIALSDTFTTDIFFEAFDTKFAKLFDGVRHDSGDPIEFAEKTIRHYKKLRIDPLSKTIIFSDSLNPNKVKKIIKHCHNKIKMSFGIGTNFTNDVGVKPLNIVMKMTASKPEGQAWYPTIKLSDTKGKHSGDIKMIELCKTVLQIV